MLPFDPKKPLHSFRAKCPHAWRQIQLFRDENDFVYFRPRTAPADWIGTFRGNPYGSWDSESTWMYAKNSIRPYLAKSGFWRVFYLPDPRQGEHRMWRIGWRPDYGYVEALDRKNEYNWPIAYFWPRSAKFNLWKTPTSVLQQHFEREWHDQRSDVRAALPWCDLPNEERAKRAVIWKRGNYDEFQRLVLSALRIISFRREWDQGTPVYPFHVWLYWDINGQHIQPDIHGVKMHPDRRCWRRLCARIAEHHWGAYDFSNGSRNDWAFSWIEYEPPISSRRAATIGFDVSEPNQHERLEAALFLRDWLRENAPDLLPDWFPSA